MHKRKLIEFLKWINLGVCIAVVIGVSVFNMYNNKQTDDLIAKQQGQIECYQQKVTSYKEQLEAKQKEVEQYMYVIQDNTNNYNANIEWDQRQIDSLSEALSTYTATFNCPYSTGEMILLAKCMQTEAGPYKGHEKAQRAIGQVILNRLAAGNFGNSITEVIYQKNSEGVIQFSTAYDGAISNCVLEPETLLNAYRVVIQGTSYPKNLLYFCSVTLDFSRYVNFYTEIEGTAFYTDGGN